MSSSRPRTVTTAGALLVGAVLAAVPSHAAHAAAASAHRDTTAPTITVTTSGQSGSTTLSTSSITPGGVMFDLVGRGSVDVITFHGHYTLADLSKDAKKLFSGDVKTVRRVDKHVVFWGGAPASRKAPSLVGMDLPAGTYYVVNLDKATYATLTVSGPPEARALPAPGGTIKYVHDMTFRIRGTLPKQGWVDMRNKATEPHFTDLQKVKKGTTAHQVRTWLKNGASGQPSWGLAEFHGNMPVSPDHSFEWYLDASKGEYVALCWWPSDETGMPHALMGMFGLAQVR
jgi:hypothetical protein